MPRVSSRLFPNRALGKLVRANRLTKNLSIRQYAQDAGIRDHTLVLRLECGHDVRLSAYLKLAKAHGLPMEVAPKCPASA